MNLVEPEKFTKSFMDIIYYHQYASLQQPFKISQHINMMLDDKVELFA